MSKFLKRPFVAFAPFFVLGLFVLVACATPQESPANVVEYATTTTPTTVVLTTTTSSTTTSTTSTIVVPVPTTMAAAPEPIVEEPVAPPADLVGIEKMICDTFAGDCDKALSVVYCESRFNPSTVGSAGERGLFQIHPVHIPYLQERGLTWDAMFDPQANIAYAYDLYARAGWGPWTCA